MNNIYLQLTRKFNSGRVRAILTGDQAVVLHRLAIMSSVRDLIALAAQYPDKVRRLAEHSSADGGT